MPQRQYARSMGDDSGYDIAIHQASGQTSVDLAPSERALRAALRRHGVRRARVTLAVVDDREIARLHGIHLGRAAATDVLTFDLRDRADGETEVDGEVVVSVDTAAREAGWRGHTVDAELALYAVHGVLHLLGYDDRNDRGACRMHAMEDQVLSEVGLGSVYGRRRK